MSSEKSRNLSNLSNIAKSNPIYNISSIFQPKEDPFLTKIPKSHARIQKELIDSNELKTEKIDYFFIRTADNNDLKIPFSKVIGMTILSLKKFAFPKQMEENKNVRLIMKGKLLDENELVKKCKIDRGGFVQAFISEKIEKKTEKGDTTKKTDRSVGNSNIDFSTLGGGYRGFDRIREMGCSEQTIIMQR